MNFETPVVGQKKLEVAVAKNIPQKHQKYLERAKQFLEQRQAVLTDIAGDRSLRYSIGKGFFINLEEGIINVDIGFWEKQEKYGWSDEQMFWAVCHEIAHFWDLREDPEGMLANFEYMKHKGIEVAEVVEQILRRKYPQLPEYLTKKKHKISKRDPRRYSGLEVFIIKRFREFYNCLDDIYVNKRVGRKVLPFLIEESGLSDLRISPVVEDLYREHLFPASKKKEDNSDKRTEFYHLEDSARHTQLMYYLLRKRMVPDQPIIVDDEVKDILQNTNLGGVSFEKFVDLLVTPGVIGTKSDSRAGIRYQKIRQFVEPAFIKLLLQDLENEEIPPESETKPEGGAGGEGGDPSGDPAEPEDSDDSSGEPGSSDQLPKPGGNKSEKDDDKDDDDGDDGGEGKDGDKNKDKDKDKDGSGEGKDGDKDQDKDKDGGDGKEGDKDPKDGKEPKSDKESSAGKKKKTNPWKSPGSKEQQQINEDTVRDFLDSKRKKETQEKRAKKKAQRLDTPQARQREMLEVADQEFSQTHNVPVEAIKKYRSIANEVWPFQMEMAQVFELISRKIRSQVSMVWDRYYHSGRLDVQKFIRKYGHFLQEGAVDFIPFDALSSYEKKQFLEKLIIKPDEFRLRLVIDSSGSTNGAVMETMLRVIVLYLESLATFEDKITRMFKEESLTIPPLKINTQLIQFGDTAKVLKPLHLTRVIPQAQERAERINGVYSIAVGGNTHDDTAWAEVLRTRNPGDEEKIKQGDLLDLAIEITDGASSNPEGTAQMVDQVHESGILARAIQINLGDGPEAQNAQQIFEGIWGEEGESIRTLSDLVPAMYNLLKQAIEQIDFVVEMVDE